MSVSNYSQSSLKILHVLDHSLPVHSGYAFRSQDIIEAQRNRGWRAVGLTSPKHQAAWKGIPTECDDSNRLRYFRTDALANRFPVAAELELIKALARRIESVAKIEHPDVLHAHSPVLNAVAALWAGYKLRLPVVYEVRAFWEDAMVDRGTCSNRSLRYFATRTLETWVCRYATEIAVICEGLRTDLIKRGVPKNKISIVPNGINPERFSVKEPNLTLARDLGIGGKKVVGFIGSFNRYEGLDLLLRAIARIAAMRSDIVLLLVGGGETERELRDQIAHLKMKDFVIMTGRIPQEKIPSVYSIIDVLVYPRYSVRLTDLVTPLKPLESMAMGKPIIASDVGGHQELIKDGYTGVLFKSGDAVELARAIEHAIDNPELRSRLAAQASDWVRNNRSWEKTTSVHSEMYSRALGKCLPDVPSL